ncbi:MAG: D-2-hydroxyacid dehydrogenase family protein [Betaproteobacteria bacterium]|nr:D-2-hydroxyacid dehydrogenase family protein [Betaproteobacteria bacterium]
MSARQTIVVLDDYEQAMRRFADWTAIDGKADVVVHSEKLRGAALLDAIRDADAIAVVRDRTPFKADLLAQLPKLRYLVYTGVRNTQLDAAAFAARAIPVSHTEKDPGKDSTAEHTWALMLAASRRLEAGMAMVREGRWRDGGALASILRGERLGLVGFGEIGQRVGLVGKAFGMELVTWSPHMTPERAAAGGAKAVPLEELLATSKVVSLHLVPSEATRRLLDAGRLATMRPDSILVNTSRSTLIDMTALPAALEAGRPGIAALDVFDEEPLPADFPLRRLANVVLTPHVGFVARPVYEKFARGMVECLDAWLEGRPLVRVLPPPG